MTRFIVFEGGHITEVIAAMLPELDFVLVVYHDRPKFSSPARFPWSRGLSAIFFSDISSYLSINPSDYLVIATGGTQARRRFSYICAVWT
jgi:hypothetical protein